MRLLEKLQIIRKIYRALFAEITVFLTFLLGLFVTGPRGEEVFKNDIAELCDWESRWQMNFNRSECFVMHMSHKKNPWLTLYNPQDFPLQSSTTQKYLGIKVTSNLNWNIHINTISTKANKTLGLPRRQFRSCSPATKETAYKAHHNTPNGVC